MNLRRLPLGILLVLLVVLAHRGAVLYAPTDPSVYDRGFVYDDEAVILLNRPTLEDWSSIPRFLGDASLFTGAKGNAMFRPVAHASHVVDAHLWGWGPTGPPPRGWRLTNLLLHAATAFVLYHLLRRILEGQGLGDPFGSERASGAATAAFLGALWFGLQPVNSEVVHYVTARSESLAALFFLGSLLALHASWEADIPSRRRIALGAGAFLCALLSFGSKESGLLLPLVAAVMGLATGVGPIADRGGRASGGGYLLFGAFIVYAVLRRIALPRSEPGTVIIVLGTILLILINRLRSRWILERIESFRNLVRARPLVIAGIAGALLLAAAALAPSDPGVAPLVGGGRSLAAHLLTQARVAMASGLLLLFPVDLTPDHGVRVAAGLDLPTAVALLLLPALAVAAVRGSRMVVLAAAWAVLAAAPSFLRPLNVVMNEHRLYLPSTGLALAVGLGLLGVLTAARRAGREVRAAAGGGLIVVFLAFALVDDGRARAWANPTKLWERAVAASPDSWRSHLHLGVEYYRVGEQAYRQAAGSDEVGRAFGELAGRHNLDAALAEFEEAQRLSPLAFETRLNLGRLRMLRGDLANRLTAEGDPIAAPEEYEASIRWFTAAEESSPGSFRALYNRATAMAHAGKVAEATAEFERLAQEKSRTTMYAYPLADLYRRAKRWDDALAQLELIERVQPADAGTVAVKRAEVLTQAGRFQEGEAALRRAASLLGPQDPAPPLYMARLLAATGVPENLLAAKTLWAAALSRGHVPGPKDRELLRALRGE